MDRETTRQLRDHLRLHYPMRVVAVTGGFVGSYPDLPGCACMSWELPLLYTKLEERRRKWIAQRVVAGEPVPLPNSYLAGTRSTATTRRLRAVRPAVVATL